MLCDVGPRFLHHTVTRVADAGVRLSSLPEDVTVIGLPRSGRARVRPAGRDVRKPNQLWSWLGLRAKWSRLSQDPM